MDKTTLQNAVKRFRGEIADIRNLAERLEKEISELTIPVADSFDNEAGHFLHYWFLKGYNESLGLDNEYAPVKRYSFETNDDGEGKILLNNYVVTGYNAKTGAMLQFIEDAADLLEFVKTLKPKKQLQETE